MVKNSSKKGKKYSVNFVSEARAASSVVHRARDLTALATLRSCSSRLVLQDQSLIVLLTITRYNHSCQIIYSKSLFHYYKNVTQCQNPQLNVNMLQQIRCFVCFHFCFHFVQNVKAFRTLRLIFRGLFSKHIPQKHRPR